MQMEVVILESYHQRVYCSIEEERQEEAPMKNDQEEVMKQNHEEDW